MMAVSFRLDVKKILLGLALVLAVFGLLAAARHATADWWEANPASARVTRQIAGATEGERMRFINSFGWEVEKNPAEVVEVTIPKDFDQVYQKYNLIQKQQGYDLKKYGGKRCSRYTYIIKNYPGAQQGIRLNLLVYNGKIIGGDVMSVRLGGFMHGFALPPA